MKQIKLLPLCILLGSLACLGSCSDDDNDVTPDGQLEVLPSAIQLNEFETDEGEIGISLNARPLARKGYQPATAVISVDASGIGEHTVPFDEFNNLANLAFENSDLPDDVENALKDGVAVTVTILDKDGNELATESFSRLSFRSSPAEQMIDDTALPDKYISVSIRENVEHYVQILSPDNAVNAVPSSDQYVRESSNNQHISIPVRVVPIGDITYPSSYADRFTSYFFRPVPGEPNTYNIFTLDGPDLHNWYIGTNNGDLRIQTKDNIDRNKGNFDPIANNYPNYFFRLEKKGPGMYSIISVYTGHPLRISGQRLNANTATNEPAYFRVLALDIDWDIQTLSAEFMTPIMPPTSTSSAYNSTLRNCSSGTLSQNVGETTTVTSTQMAGWEESMSVSTSNEGSVSLTLSTEAETNFFGTGGKTSASVTGSYTYTKTETQTSTRSGSLTTSKSVQVSVSRDVGVPPGTAISVADIYQQYENVRVPFVQRFRIFGEYQKDNSALRGEEILTQFAFNSFTGVVTDVQDDFIEVTVRGTTTIDRLIETTTESRDIPNACN